MRRRSATWTACCRPRTSRAPMPSSSVGRPRRTYPSRVCQRRACTSCSPARRPIRRCTRPSRPMRGGPCANTSGTRTSMPRTAPCRAASPCSRWLRQRGARAAGARLSGPGGRRASIHAWPLCRRLSRRPWLHPEAIAYLLACAGNIQHLRHRKTYAERIANADSLGWLLEARRRVAGDALPRSRRCARISWASASTRRHSGPRAMRSGASRRTGSRRPGDPQRPRAARLVHGDIR